MEDSRARWIATLAGLLFVVPCLVMAADALSDRVVLSRLGATVAQGNASVTFGVFFLALAAVIVLGILAFWDVEPSGESEDRVTRS